MNQMPNDDFDGRLLEAVREKRDWDIRQARAALMTKRSIEYTERQWEEWETGKRKPNRNTAAILEDLFDLPRGYFRKRLSEQKDNLGLSASI